MMDYCFALSLGAWGSFLQEKKSAVEPTNGESKPNKKEKKESGKKTEVKNGHGSDTNHSLANLSQQLDVAEEAQVQCSGYISRKDHPTYFCSLKTREGGPVGSRPFTCCVKGSHTIIYIYIYLADPGKAGAALQTAL